LSSQDYTKGRDDPSTILSLNTICPLGSKAKTTNQVVPVNNRLRPTASERLMPGIEVMVSHNITKEKNVHPFILFARPPSRS
jgi:hypothetical protein